MMRRVFIEAEKQVYPVRMLCRVLKVSPAAYYRWRHRSREAHDAELALRAQIVEIHNMSGETYGAPRIVRQLRRNGVICNRKRVARLMLAELISGLRRPHFRRPRRVSDALPDLVQRDFSAPAPDLLWMADVTQIATATGWLFVAVVMDAYSRRIVGWAMGESADTELVAMTVDMAVARRQPRRGLIHHSDRGAPYLSVVFGNNLRNAGIQQSVGAARTCYDNAAMESFFATLKKDLVHRWRVLKTREEATSDVFGYLEGFYNRRRLHSYLGYVPPEEFEGASQPAA